MALKIAVKNVVLYRIDPVDPNASYWRWVLLDANKKPVAGSEKIFSRKGTAKAHIRRLIEKIKKYPCHEVGLL